MSTSNGEKPIFSSGYDFILDSVKTSLFQRETLTGECLAILYLILKSEDSANAIENLREYFRSNGLIEDLTELDSVLNTLKCQNIKVNESNGYYEHEYFAGIPVVACPLTKDFDINFKAHKRIYANYIEEALAEKIKNKNKNSKIKEVRIDVLNSFLVPRAFKKVLLTSEKNNIEKDLFNFDMPDSLVLKKGMLSPFLLPIKITMSFEESDEACLDYGDRFNETFFDLDFMHTIERLLIEHSNSYLPKKDFDIGVGMPFIISDLVEAYTAFVKKEKMFVGLHPHLKVNSPKRYITEVQVCSRHHTMQINIFQDDVLHHTFEYGPMDVYNHINEPQDVALVEDTLKTMGLEPKIIEVKELDTKCKTYFKPRLTVV